MKWIRILTAPAGILECHAPSWLQHLCTPDNIYSVSSIKHHAIYLLQAVESGRHFIQGQCLVFNVSRSLMPSYPHSSRVWAWDYWYLLLAPACILECHACLNSCLQHLCAPDNIYSIKNHAAYSFQAVERGKYLFKGSVDSRAAFIVSRRYETTGTFCKLCVI